MTTGARLGVVTGAEISTGALESAIGAVTGAWIGAGPSVGEGAVGGATGLSVTAIGATGLSVGEAAMGVGALPVIEISAQFQNCSD